MTSFNPFGACKWGYSDISHALGSGNDDDSGVINMKERFRLKCGAMPQP